MTPQNLFVQPEAGSPPDQIVDPAVDGRAGRIDNENEKTVITPEEERRRRITPGVNGILVIQVDSCPGLKRLLGRIRTVI
jgi:hypothetical protein